MEEFGKKVFQTLSGPAVRAIMSARAEAGRLGAQRLEPEHLLWGLLWEDQREWEPEFRSGRLGLARAPDEIPPPPFFSGELAAKLRQVSSESAEPGVPKPDAMDMPIAPASERILMAAHERAQPSRIGLLHLLWAMMGDPENSAGDLLKSNGVTMEQIEGAIRNWQQST